MTTLTIPYTLEDDNGAVAPDYKPETIVPMQEIFDVYERLEADEATDDEIRETLLECVREHFVTNMGPIVGETLLEGLVQQVRAALVARDSAQALPDPA